MPWDWRSLFPGTPQTPANAGGGFWNTVAENYVSPDFFGDIQEGYDWMRGSKPAETLFGPADDVEEPPTTALEKISDPVRHWSDAYQHHGLVGGTLAPLGWGAQGIEEGLGAAQQGLYGDLTIDPVTGQQKAPWDLVGESLFPTANEELTGLDVAAQVPAAGWAAHEFDPTVGETFQGIGEELVKTAGPQTVDPTNIALAAPFGAANFANSALAGLFSAQMLDEAAKGYGRSADVAAQEGFSPEYLKSLVGPTFAAGMGGLGAMHMGGEFAHEMGKPRVDPSLFEYEPSLNTYGPETTAFDRTYGPYIVGEDRNFQAPERPYDLPNDRPTRFEERPLKPIEENIDALPEQPFEHPDMQADREISERLAIAEAAAETGRNYEFPGQDILDFQRDLAIHDEQNPDVQEVPTEPQGTFEDVMEVPHEWSPEGRQPLPDLTEQQIRDRNLLDVEGSERAAQDNWERMKEGMNAEEQANLEEVPAADQPTFQKDEKIGDLEEAQPEKTVSFKPKMSPRLIREMSGKIYGSDLGKVIVKETLQNAIDAIPQDVRGKVSADYNPQTREVSVEDNGIGMLPEVAMKEFMNPGESYKPEGSAGGFGAAKIAIFGNADKIYSETRAKDPRTGKVISTVFDTTGDEWIEALNSADPEATMKATTKEMPPDTPTGTTIKIGVRKETKVEDYQVRSYMDTFKQTHRLPHEINLTMEGRPIASWDKPDKSVEHIKTITTKSGVPMEIHAGKPTGSTSMINVHVLNKGIPQFSYPHYLDRQANVPRRMIVDVRAPKEMDVASADYPFTVNREQLTVEANEAISDYVNKDLVKDAVASENQLYRDTILNAPKIKGTDLKFVDATGKIPPELSEAIASHPVYKKIVKDMEFFHDQIKQVIARATGNTAFNDVDFHGLGYSPDWKAVNIPGSFIDSANNITLVSPWSAVRDAVVMQDKIGGNAAQFAGERMAGSTIHEVLHQGSRQHGEDMTSLLTEQIPHLTKFIDRFAGKIAKHLEGNYDGISGLDTLTNHGGELSAAGGDIFQSIRARHSEERIPSAREGGREIRETEGIERPEDLRTREPHAETIGDVGEPPEITKKPTRMRDASDSDLAQKAQELFDRNPDDPVIDRIQEELNRRKEAREEQDIPLDELEEPPTQGAKEIGDIEEPSAAGKSKITAPIRITKNPSRTGFKGPREIGRTLVYPERRWPGMDRIQQKAMIRAMENTPEYHSLIDYGETLYNSLKATMEKEFAGDPAFDRFNKQRGKQLSYKGSTEGLLRGVTVPKAGHKAEIRLSPHTIIAELIHDIHDQSGHPEMRPGEYLDVIRNSPGGFAGEIRRRFVATTAHELIHGFHEEATHKGSDTRTALWAEGYQEQGKAKPGTEEHIFQTLWKAVVTNDKMAAGFEKVQKAGHGVSDAKLGDWAARVGEVYAQESGRGKGLTPEILKEGKGQSGGSQSNLPTGKGAKNQPPVTTGKGKGPAKQTGGSGKPPGGKPPVELPAHEEPHVRKLVELMKANAAARSEQMKSWRSIRKGQAEQLKKAHEHPRYSGKKILTKTRQILSGELPKEAFERVEQLTSKETTQLFNQITKDKGLREFEKARAHFALAKILDKNRTEPLQPNELNLLGKVFGNEFEEAIGEMTGRGVQLVKKGVNVIGTMRSIQSSFDMSAPLRQAFIATAEHPIRAMQAGKEMIKSYFSEEAAKQVHHNVINNEHYANAIDRGLEFTGEGHGKEEIYADSYADGIPVIGNLIVKPSERAFHAYLNKLRMDVFADSSNRLVKSGLQGEALLEAQDQMAKYINITTGRGYLGKVGEQIAGPLNAIFYSPKLQLSRAQYLSSLATGFSKDLGGFGVKLPKTERIRAMRGALQAGIMGLGFLNLYGLRTDAKKVETDPRSPNFGRYREGKTSVDNWGGYQPWIRLVAQLATNQRKNPYGRVVDMAKEHRQPGNQIITSLKFLESKLSPFASLVDEAIQGKNIRGESFNRGYGVQIGSKKIGFGAIYERMLPMFMSDLFEAIKDRGIQDGLGMAAPGWFGAGVSTFDPEKKEEPKRLTDLPDDLKTMYERKVKPEMPSFFR